MGKNIPEAKTAVLAVLAMAAHTVAAGAVKYCGLFINDEDWGLRPWAVRRFGAEEQIGKGAYKEIFGAMKRMGFNLVWPAMHEGGYEFSEREENFALADSFGITVGTSHCEPMLRNNCYIPKKDRHLWSWTKHRDFMEDYWREGVRRGQDHNAMYTLGMRGIHDGKMKDGDTLEGKRAILEDVFAAQKSMLPPDAPTVFCPYKEVLPIYNAGLETPEDATLLWVNDNFGYVRRLAPGLGAKQGIYWHLSYWGYPHGYTHLCTTPPALAWYELVAKCWANGVRDVWMVNAGDVFQAEALLYAIGRFAANPDAWGPDAQHRVLASWAEQFGEAKESVVRHLEEYFNLGFVRKPEFMCVQWTRNLPDEVKSSLLARYHALLEEEDRLEVQMASCGKGFADGYFRAIGFQVRFLALAGIIHLEGKSKEEAKALLAPIHARWDALEGGKWAAFWCDTIDESGGGKEPKTNRWSSQMQWPWNEPADPDKALDRGVPRSKYPATQYSRNVPEPQWIECAAKAKGATGGEWVETPGLGTSAKALALLPVEKGKCEGARLEYRLPEEPKRTLVLQFLPDFALVPEEKLGVEVSFDGGEAVFVEVPRSNANLGERDWLRNAAVQDNFIRASLAIPEGSKVAAIVATVPGVVIDKLGIRN